MDNPVYVFSGFLDSGKTSVIKDTLNDKRFNEGERTLLIVFERGDEEYDEQFLSDTNSQVVYFDSVKDFSLEEMKKLEINYHPERIMVELNGMEDDKDFFNVGLIEGWEMAQVLTTVDATTFRLYSANMRQFIFNHIVSSECVIVNRCEDEDLRYIRNNIKGINQRADVIFEDSNGNPVRFSNENLFDVSQDLNILDVDYGLWYMDALDSPWKYEGKKIELNAKYIEDVKEYENVGIMGRLCMACCAQDMTDIGFSAIGIDKAEMEIGKYYHLNAHIKVLKDQLGYDTCALYIDDLKETDPPQIEYVTFS